jgi:hypothetical protein
VIGSPTKNLDHSNLEHLMKNQVLMRRILINFRHGEKRIHPISITSVWTKQYISASTRLSPSVPAIPDTAQKTTSRTLGSMSSDADYASFLDKANEDTGAPKATAQSQRKSTKAVNTDVPEVLRDVDEVLVTDSDEPFEPVSLKYSGDKLPRAS